jgi:phage-related tail protein
MNENLSSIIDSEKFKALLDEVVSQRLTQFVRQHEEKAKEVSLIERMVRVEEAIQAQQKVLESLQREMSARFEATDKSFQAMDKRFEVLQREMSARFEATDKSFQAMDKRFEAMDKRFEALQREMSARFEAMDKRFSLVQWVVVGGFTFLSILITLVNFVT